MPITSRRGRRRDHRTRLALIAAAVRGSCAGAARAALDLLLDLL